MAEVEVKELHFHPRVDYIARPYGVPPPSVLIPATIFLLDPEGSLEKISTNLMWNPPNLSTQVLFFDYFAGW